MAADGHARWRYAAAALVLVAVVLGAAELLAFWADAHGAHPLTPEGRLDREELARRNAREAGVAADPRPLGAVIKAASAGGDTAFPLLSVAYYLDAQQGSKVVLDGEPVLPLSVVPGGVGFYCNESGRYPAFATDRYGFRNPDTAWNAPGGLLIVGDSMAMGSCLPAEESFAGLLREARPQLLNLSVGSNGPLMELATLVEYLPTAQPRQVLWVYFENDLEDLLRDAANPILRRYAADPRFSQRLLDRWPRLVPEVDRLARSYLEAVLAAEAAAAATPQPRWSPARSHALRRWRYWQASRHAVPAEHAPPSQLVHIIARARAAASGSGGSLSVLFIPDCGERPAAAQEQAQAVMQGLAKEGIPVIDARASLSGLQLRGEKAYTFCPGGHLTAAASREIAKLVQEKL
jgi:hypothetical protein